MTLLAEQVLFLTCSAGRAVTFADPHQKSFISEFGELSPGGQPCQIPGTP
jgi:hypothetical protein